MMAEVLVAEVGGAYAEVAEHGGGGSRGISLQGNRLIVWTEGGGRREVLLDVFLDRYSAEQVYEALKRVEDGARFGLLFDALANAEVCVGVDGHAYICNKDFGYVVGRI